LTFFLLLNFATSGGHLYSVDDIQYYLHTENLVVNNSIKLNPNLPSVEELDVFDYLERVIKLLHEQASVVVSTVGIDVRDDNWHHVVLTYDGSSSASGVKIYVDGEVTALNTVNDNLSRTILNDEPLVIGNKNTNGKTFFKGQMDDVQVYDFELSSTEVIDLFNSSSPLAHYRFDNDLSDSTGNSNSGVINIRGSENYVTGINEKAFDFNGITHIETEDTLFDFEHDDDFSISVWFKTNVKGQGDDIIGKLSGGTGYRLFLTKDDQILVKMSNSLPSGMQSEELIPVYGRAPLLLSFLSVPLYHLTIAVSQNPINILGLVPNSIILSLTSFMIFITSIHYFKSQKIAFVLSLVFLVTTFVWSYNTGMMLRPLAGLFVILGLYFIISSNKTCLYNPLFSGTAFGFALLSSASTVLILPALILFGVIKFKNNKKHLLFFFIGLAVLIFIQAELNEIRFDSFTEFGPSQHFHHFTEGLVGYFFSLGWGLPFNFPLILFLPISLYLLFSSKNNEMKAFGIMLSLSLFSIWVFVGTMESPHWSGYGGWGPRYFTTIVPLVVLSLGFVIKEYSQNKFFKIGFIGLASFGFFVNFMGKLIWYMYGYGYGWLILKTHIMENGWLQQNYNIFYSPLSLHIQTLNSNFIQNMENPTIGWISRGLAPCPYDLFIYCEVGIIPFILMIISLSIVGLLILNNLKIINLKKMVFIEKIK